MTTYSLHVIKNMGAVDYNDRLAVSRALKRMIYRYGLRHSDRRKAVMAAEVISKHPLVRNVRMTQQRDEGIWCNGGKI